LGNSIFDDDHYFFFLDCTEPNDNEKKLTPDSTVADLIAATSDKNGKPTISIGTMTKNKK
jgi:hypothetical protein